MQKWNLLAWFLKVRVGEKSVVDFVILQKSTYSDVAQVKKKLAIPV